MSEDSTPSYEPYLQKVTIALLGNGDGGGPNEHELMVDIGVLIEAIRNPADHPVVEDQDPNLEGQRCWVVTRMITDFCTGWSSDEEEDR